MRHKNWYIFYFSPVGRHLIVLILPFSCLLLVQMAKTNMREVYYLYPVIYELHRMVTYSFVTSGAPLDWCYSPIFFVYSWPDGLNKYRWPK